MRANRPLKPVRRRRLSGSRARAFLRAFIIGAIGWIAAIGAPVSAAAPAEDSAVVIMYHRFGEGRYPSTNVTLAQLDAHIAELKSGGYNVIALSAIVAAMKTKTPLPPRTVGISIDDGFLSIYNEAWPRFRKAALPFTVFITTDVHDHPVAGYMSWAQIKEMAADPLVEIGGHSASHLSMAASSAEKSRADLSRSHDAHRDKLGKVPTLFAYPYGEASATAIQVAREFGYAVAFGQHSGAFDSGSETFYLPRFAFNEHYGDIERFRRAVRSRALPVKEIAPSDPLVTADANPPPFGFTVAAPVRSLSQISCFVSNGGAAKVERLGEMRFEIRFTKPFPKGRTRLNCTLPAGEGRWYWLGRQFYVPG